MKTMTPTMKTPMMKTTMTGMLQERLTTRPLLQQAYDARGGGTKDELRGTPTTPSSSMLARPLKADPSGPSSTMG
jgi:hypothetical protein